MRETPRLLKASAAKVTKVRRMSSEVVADVPSLNVHCPDDAQSAPLSATWVESGDYRKPIDIIEKPGAGEGIRTLDPNLGKVADSLSWGIPRYPIPLSNH